MELETGQPDLSPSQPDARTPWDVPPDTRGLQWSGPPAPVSDPGFKEWRSWLAKELESLNALGAAEPVVDPLNRASAPVVPPGSGRRWGTRLAAGAGSVLALGILGSVLGLVPNPFGSSGATLGALSLVASVEASPAVPEAAVPGVAVAPSAHPVGPRPFFSVALSAHRDVAAAVARRDALEASAPGQLFVVAPVEVNGAVFHRVLGGLGEDPAGARSAAAAISASTGEASARWIVRETALAFTLDEVARPDRAQALSRGWNQRGIPAYVLAVDYSDGSTGYRVLAGAYADHGEASYLAGVLAGMGVDPPLEERVGHNL